MAIPIAPTPVLSGKEAARFMSKIHKNSVKLVSLTPTPKLKKANKLIMNHAKNQQK